MVTIVANTIAAFISRQKNARKEEGDEAAEDDNDGGGGAEKKNKLYNIYTKILLFRTLENTSTSTKKYESRGTGHRGVLDASIYTVLYVASLPY